MVLMCGNMNMPGSQEFTGKMSTELNRPKSQEGRKSSKPLMEKRRRARINESLCQLKTLILEATNKDSSRHSKLEKADILEMTVKYLKNLQRHQLAGTPTSDTSGRFRLGYSECITEVSRFFSPMDNNLVDLRLRLLNHLASSCPTTAQNQPQTSTNVTSTSTTPMPSPAVAPAAVTSHIPQPLQIQVSPPINGTTTLHTVPITVATPPQTAITVQGAANPQMNTTPITRVLSGIQVNGLPGEITVMLAPQTFTNGQLTGHFIPVYQNAQVMSPSSASIPSPQSLSSPVGTATATLAQPDEVRYYHVDRTTHHTSPSPHESTIVSPQVSPAVPTFKVEPSHSPRITSPVQHHQISPKTRKRTLQMPTNLPPTKYLLQKHNMPEFQKCDEEENVWRPW